MKHSSLFLILMGLLACNNVNTQNKIPKNIPVGKVMAADSTPIKEDQLNHFHFAVTVKTNEYTAEKGSYDVSAHFGPNVANGAFSMPKGGEDLKPLLRKGKEPYTYIVGFKWQNDTTFYDYFLISAKQEQINMRYLNSYTFQ